MMKPETDKPAQHTLTGQMLCLLRPTSGFSTLTST